MAHFHKIVQNSGSAVTSISATLPADIEDNDVAVVFVALSNAGAVTVASGYTQLQAGLFATSTKRSASYWKQLTTSDASTSPSWSFASADAIISIIIVRNADVTSPINGSVAPAAGAGATTTWTTVTRTPSPARTILALNAFTGATSTAPNVDVTNPSNGYTERGIGIAQGGGIAHVICTREDDALRTCSVTSCPSAVNSGILVQVNNAIGSTGSLYMSELTSSITIVGSPDIIPPTIFNLAPTTATTISGSQVISFSITDNIDETELAKVVVMASYSGYPNKEVIYNSASFSPNYSNVNNTKNAIASGSSFTLLRDNGWPSPVVTLTIVGIDTSGNDATPVDYTWNTTVPSAAPQVLNFSPTVASEITATTPIEFDVVDSTGLFRRIILIASYAGTQEKDLVHDGEAFDSNFSNVNCVRTTITGGYHYKILRDGGWTGSSISITPYIIDTEGFSNA